MANNVIVICLMALFALPLAGCQTTSKSDRTEFRLQTTWMEFETNSAASLRGIDALNEKVAWACGSDGTILRTINGGRSWQDVSFETGKELDFRSIYVLNDDTAMVLSAGSPARLYRTTNGGKYWSLVYEDVRPEIFFDAMRFADLSFGLAFSDPIDGVIPIIATDDWGRAWQPHAKSACPVAIEGEAGFAASNSGITFHGDNVLIGLGGQTSLGKARVAHSTDRGQTWTMIQTPMPCSASAGIFSITFINEQRVVAVGGDYLNPDSVIGSSSYSKDGGRSWKLATEKSAPRGYRSGVAPFPMIEDGVVLSVGPSGSDLSVDYGQSWIGLDDAHWHALKPAADGSAMWLSGPDGRVGVIRLNK